MKQWLFSIKKIDQLISSHSPSKDNLTRGFYLRIFLRERVLWLYPKGTYHGPSQEIELIIFLNRENIFAYANNSDKEWRKFEQGASFFHVKNIYRSHGELSMQLSQRKVGRRCVQLFSHEVLSFYCPSRIGNKRRSEERLMVIL